MMNKKRAIDRVLSKLKSTLIDQDYSKQINVQVPDEEYFFNGHYTRSIACNVRTTACPRKYRKSKSVALTSKTNGRKRVPKTTNWCRNFQIILFDIAYKPEWKKLVVAYNQESQHIRNLSPSECSSKFPNRRFKKRVKTTCGERGRENKKTNITTKSTIAETIVRRRSSEEEEEFFGFDLGNSIDLTWSRNSSNLVSRIENESTLPSMSVKKYVPPLNKEDDKFYGFESERVSNKMIGNENTFMKVFPGIDDQIVEISPVTNGIIQCSKYENNISEDIIDRSGGNGYTDLEKIAGRTSPENFKGFSTPSLLNGITSKSTVYKASNEDSVGLGVSTKPSEAGKPCDHSYVSKFNADEVDSALKKIDPINEVFQKESIHSEETNTAVKNPPRQSTVQRTLNETSVTPCISTKLSETWKPSDHSYVSNLNADEVESVVRKIYSINEASQKESAQFEESNTAVKNPFSKSTVDRAANETSFSQFSETSKHSDQGSVIKRIDEVKSVVKKINLINEASWGKSYVGKLDTAVTNPLSAISRSKIGTVDKHVSNSNNVHSNNFVNGTNTKLTKSSTCSMDSKSIPTLTSSTVNNPSRSTRTKISKIFSASGHESNIVYDEKSAAQRKAINWRDIIRNGRKLIRSRVAANNLCAIKKNRSDNNVPEDIEFVDMGLLDLVAWNSGMAQSNSVAKVSESEKNICYRKFDLLQKVDRRTGVKSLEACHSKIETHKVKPDTFQNPVTSANEMQRYKNPPHEHIFPKNMTFHQREAEKVVGDLFNTSAHPIAESDISMNIQYNDSLSKNTKIQANENHSTGSNPALSSMSNVNAVSSIKISKVVTKPTPALKSIDSLESTDECISHIRITNVVSMKNASVPSSKNIESTSKSCAISKEPTSSPFVTPANNMEHGMDRKPGSMIPGILNARKGRKKIAAERHGNAKSKQKTAILVKDNDKSEMNQNTGSGKNVPFVEGSSKRSEIEDLLLQIIRELDPSSVVSPVNLGENTDGEILEKKSCRKRKSSKQNSSLKPDVTEDKSSPNGVSKEKEVDSAGVVRCRDSNVNSCSETIPNICLNEPLAPHHKLKDPFSQSNIRSRVSDGYEKYDVENISEEVPECSPAHTSIKCNSQTSRASSVAAISTHWLSKSRGSFNSSNSSKNETSPISSEFLKVVRVQHPTLNEGCTTTNCRSESSKNEASPTSSKRLKVVRVVEHRDTNEGPTTSNFGPNLRPHNSFNETTIRAILKRYFDENQLYVHNDHAYSKFNSCDFENIENSLNENKKTISETSTVSAVDSKEFIRSVERSNNPLSHLKPLHQNFRPDLMNAEKISDTYPLKNDVQEEKIKSIPEAYRKIEQGSTNSSSVICWKCGITCRCDRMFGVHFISSHLDDSVLQCLYCSKEFNHTECDEFEQHYNEHLHQIEEDRKKKVLESYNCKKEGAYVKSFSKDGSVSFSCLECNHRTTSCRAIEIHLKEMHSVIRKRLISCNYCTLQFSSGFAKRYHCLNKHREKMMYCDYCFWLYTSKPSYYMHLKICPVRRIEDDKDIPDHRKAIEEHLWWTQNDVTSVNWTSEHDGEKSIKRQIIAKRRLKNVV